MGVAVQPLESAPAVVESCGSPGEVASDPFLGHRFWFGKERYSNVAEYTQFENLPNYAAARPGTTAQQAHTAAALHSC